MAASTFLQFCPVLDRDKARCIAALFGEISADEREEPILWVSRLA